MTTWRTRSLDRHNRTREARLAGAAWVSPKVAARMLGISSRSVLFMVIEHRIPHAFVDDGRYGQAIFLRSDIQKIAETWRPSKTGKATPRPEVMTQ